MTTDAFTAAATEAARKRLAWHDLQFGDIMRPMVWMAEWARDHLARQEASDLDEVSWRLSLLLDNCTGGRMSKPNYTVDAMIREIEDHYDREHEASESEREPEDAEVEAALNAHMNAAAGGRDLPLDAYGALDIEAMRAALAAAKEARA